MLMTPYGICHGDEEWVLKGIGQDLAHALGDIDVFPNNIVTTDKVFQSEHLNTDFHIFVQQGQLNININNNSLNMPANTICLFKHLDINNFRPDMLHECRAVIFYSSIQPSQEIANGHNPSDTYSHPHGVNTSFHKIIPKDNSRLIQMLIQIKDSNKIYSHRSSVGFCGNYCEKYTYTMRKNYNKIKRIVEKLILAKVLIILLDPGWSEFFIEYSSSPYLLCIITVYKNYPLIYNLIGVFISLSIHEGGPLPLLESMSCRYYPILTNTGFTFDTIKDNFIETLVSPFDNDQYIYDCILEKWLIDSHDSTRLREHPKKFSLKHLSGLIRSYSDSD